MMQLATHGAQCFGGTLAASEVEALEAALGSAAQDRPGIRLFNIPALRPLVGPLGPIGKIATEFLGAKAQPVRATLFDKTSRTNWSLGWHQDRVIAVKEKLPVRGFGPWTQKSDVLHVAPPISILRHMITLRVHIDPVCQNNAPLLFASGSHQLGLVPESEIEHVINRSEIQESLAESGDVWAYATLILHAAKAASGPTRRRVLQIDYSADDLPGGLEWLGI